MELLDKKLTGPGPEISVHPGVTLILSFLFFVTFFLTENRETACFTGDYSTLTNRFCSIMYLINNIIRKYNSLVLSVALISCIPSCFMRHEKEKKKNHYNVNLINKENKTFLSSFVFLFLFFFYIRHLIKNTPLHRTRLTIRNL